MARRISSIFSLGSNSSNASTNDSRPRSAFNPDRIAYDRPPWATLASPKSTPDLRPTTPSQRYQAGQQLDTGRGISPHDPSRLSPMRSPAPISSNDANGTFLPILRKPLPQQAGSTDVGRPVSRASGAGSRASSKDGSYSNSRPVSPAKLRPTTPTTEQTKLMKKRQWLPGGKSRPDCEDSYKEGTAGFDAWNIAYPAQANSHYDLTPLVSFQKVPELWNDACDTYIHLHDKSCQKGPSFKIDSSLYASSKSLTAVAWGNNPHPNGHTSSQHQHSSQDGQYLQLLERTSAMKVGTPISPPASQNTSSTGGSSIGRSSTPGYFEDGSQRRRDVHLGITLELEANTANPNEQLTAHDVDLLVTVRNAFALLAGLPLVGTPARPSVFSIFVAIAEFLQHHEFTNLDGSSLGEEVSSAFALRVSEFRLADLRSSREKTIEALILGERMKYWPLYNEGFVHAVGKYDSLVSLKSKNFRFISDGVHKRMEIASIELSRRLRKVQGRLNDFDFASMWSGIANSRTSSDSKGIRFKAWRAAFNDMRDHVRLFYKERYGAWPPKAKSKKNNFEESGLNRILLRELYTDFSDLYDALVDRTSLTTRHMEIPSSDMPEDMDQEPTSRALRRILSEYDRSDPPVQPPIPFDTPLLPSLTSIRPNFLSLDPKRQKKEATRTLDSSEINLALLKSYNRDHNQDPLKPTPFIDAYTTFSLRSARSTSLSELIDIRVGQWIFLYAVLQALPPVVIDAPGLNFTQGVEYFLCQVPKGSAPWIQENHQQKQSWYGISGGTGVVSLPADLVEHGVDGIYRRSHCWTIAEKWAGPVAVASNGYDDPFSSTGASNYDYAPPPNPTFSDHPYQLQPGSPRILPSFAAEELQPPVMPGSRPDSRASSRSPTRDRRGSMALALGLEQLPLPAGVSPTGSRPTSTYDPNMSFDKILAGGGGGGGVEGGGGGKKGRKK